MRFSNKPGNWVKRFVTVPSNDFFLIFLAENCFESFSRQPHLHFRPQRISRIWPTLFSSFQGARKNWEDKPKKCWIRILVGNHNFYFTHEEIVKNYRSSSHLWDLFKFPFLCVCDEKIYILARLKVYRWLDS